MKKDKAFFSFRITRPALMLPRSGGLCPVWIRKDEKKESLTLLRPLRSHKAAQRNDFLLVTSLVLLSSPHTNMTGRKVKDVSLASQFVGEDRFADKENISSFISLISFPCSSHHGRCLCLFVSVRPWWNKGKEKKKCSSKIGAHKATNPVGFTLWPQ